MEQRDLNRLLERHGEEHVMRTVFDPNYTGFLSQKWESVLAGLKCPQHMKQSCAMVLENQLTHMKRVGRRGLSEDVTTNNVGSYTKYIFPILRKLFPNLIAHNLVTVQPLSAPIGAVFFWDYKYGTTKGSVTAGQSAPGTSPYYSSEYIDGQNLGLGDGAKWGGGGAAAGWQLSFYPVRPLNTTYGYSCIIQEQVVATGVVVQTVTDNGSGGFTGDIASGAINYATGAVTNFKFTNAVGNGNVVKAYYRYNMELNSNIPQYNFDITMEAVKAEPHKIRFTWSPESVEDLASFHGEMGESQLVAGAAQQMLYEMDRDVVEDLKSFSATGSTATFDMSLPVGVVNTLDALRRIFYPLNDVSAAIHRKTLRAPANWIVTSPQVSSLLENFATNGDYRGIFTQNADPQGALDYQQVAPSFGGLTSNMGVTKVGVLKNRWAVYQDPGFTYNHIMMGLKGDSYLDAGYAWCPYVSMEMTQTFEDPADFSMKKGIRSRYAKKRLRSDWYGLVTISGWTAV